MKKLGILGLAFAVAGNMLGAGFVSGQELWQYFGVFGVKGYLGMALSLFVLFLTSVLILLYSQREKITTVDALIVRKDLPFLRNAVGLVSIFFMFCTYVVMAAGAGALAHQVFSTPFYVGSAVLCIAVAFVTLSGVGGFLRIFSLFVPALLVFVFGMCVFSFPDINLEDLKLIKGAGENPMLSHWALSAFNNATYNVGCVIGIYAVMAERIKDKKTVFFGTFFGAVLLMIISSTILSMLFSSIECADYPLPMVAYATSLDHTAGIIFSVLLFMAMFATSLANSVAIAYYARKKIVLMKKTVHYIILVSLMSAACFAGSLLGFEKLVSIVFPISGYVNLVFIVMIALNFIISLRKEKTQTKVDK